MDIRKIRENLGRIKVYYLKGDTLRALAAAVAALKELGAAAAPTDVRGALREGVQLLARDEGIKTRLPAPLVYQPGQERALYALLAKLYKQMSEDAAREERDAARTRKKQLDQALILGRKLLEQGKVSEADAAFQAAVGFYKDETRLFQLIGKSLLDAGQGRRAFPYLKRAVETEPDNAAARALYDAAAKARESEPLV